jgi:hypothetical protein
MGTKTRILGADAVLRGKTESAYGTAPTSSLFFLSFKSFALDSERLLGYDALLGQGRDALDPYYEAINVNGDIVIPMDHQNLGWWMQGMFGGTDPATATHAVGNIVFSANPEDDSTITTGTTTWTFKASGATGTQINKGGTLALTLAAAVAAMNASADSETTKCTYHANATTLYYYFETAGSSGNSHAIAAGTSPASHGTASGTNLTGGAATGLYQHEWTSGDVVPSRTLEVGHPQLSTAQYHLFTGAMMGSFAFDMARTGPINATVNIVAQQRASAATSTEGGSSTSFALNRFSNGSGSIKLNNTQIANITAGRIELNNSLDPVETIRSDGLIDAIDTGEFRATGSMTVRAGTDTALSAAVSAQNPVAIEYQLTHPLGYSFTLTLPRVFLPKPKASITGPGGVEQVFDWQAAKGQDTNFTYLCKAVLINNYASAYA